MSLSMYKVVMLSGSCVIGMQIAVISASFLDAILISQNTGRAQDGVTKRAQDLIFSFSARSKAYVHKLISFCCPKQTHNQIKQILQRYKFGAFVS